MVAHPSGMALKVSLVIRRYTPLRRNLVAVVAVWSAHLGGPDR